MAEKKKQNQPKTQAGKSREVVKARRKQIMAAVANGKTQKQAGIEAGLNPNSAREQVSQILTNPSLKKSFIEILNEKIPDDFHANVYKEGMAAKRGEDEPDHPTRIKAADSVAKLKGLVVDKSQHSFDERALSVLCSILPEEYVAEFKKKLAELL